MSRIVYVVAASAGLVLVATGSARSAELLGGVAQEQYKADLERTDVDDLSDYVVHHASTAGTLEWSPNENLKLDLTMGTVTSTLEDTVGGVRTTWGSEGGFYMQTGVSIETELIAGGGLILDLSYTLGRTEWEYGTESGDYDFNRWCFQVGYVFGDDPDRARPYVALGYNTYEAKLSGLSSGTRELEYDKRFSLVGGVRSRSGTFAGVVEATFISELGVRLALMFGF